MLKIRDKFTKLKIKYKIILSMYLVIIPILIVASGYMYVRNYKETVKEMTNVYKNLTMTIDENINYLQADLLDLSTYITINSDVRVILYAKNKYSYQNQPLLWEQSAPTDFVKDMISIKSHIKSLILYPENGVQPFYISQDNSVLNREISEINDLKIYKDAVAARGDHVWTRVDKNEIGLFIKNNLDKIVISSEIFDWSKSNRIGFLSIGIDAIKYEQICENALQKKNEGILICNQYGEELVRVGMIDDIVAEYIKNDEFRSSIPNGMNNHFKYHNYYVFYSKAQTNDNIIYYMVPESNWLSKIQNVKVVSFAFGGALLLGLWPLFMLATTIISKPLKRLQQSMAKFKAGDFEQRVEVSSYDEIGEVTECFNEMVIEIKELIDTNYVMVLRERQSELDALQAQINPHFLYNALDSLYWQALNTNNDKLAEDIFSLSQLFRLVLNQGQGSIPIGREIELINHYLQIQKMRFEKKLNYRIDMEEAILEYKIPKLIIQPFVENAIVHGLECTDEKGVIEINGRLEAEHIVIEVKDNGVGMTEEQIKEVFNEDETKEYSSQRIGKYAIKNVKERLNLKYHDDFKLLIQSSVGIGTTVTIVIPASSK